MMRGVLAPDHTMLEQQEREASKGCSLGGHALVAQWQNIAVSASMARNSGSRHRKLTGHPGLVLQM